MGKSIDLPGLKGDLAKQYAGSRRNPAPRLIGSMSLQLAIPWRVGLHQSPPPLHQPRITLKSNPKSDNQNPANGELSKPKLSHTRGSPHRVTKARLLQSHLTA